MDTDAYTVWNRGIITGGFSKEKNGERRRVYARNVEINFFEWSLASFTFENLCKQRGLTRVIVTDVEVEISMTLNLFLLPPNTTVILYN